MKKIKKGSMKLVAAVTAFLMFQSFVVLAQSNVELALYRTESKVALLKVDNIRQGEYVVVTIRDAKGAVLFTERGKAEEYVKLLDFAKLGNGTYVLDIIQGKGLIRKVVVKEDSGLFVKNESYSFANYMDLKEKDKKLLVRFSNRLKEPVSVRITDSEGHILHEQSGIKTDSYTALFNLSNLSRGTYNMSLVSENFSNTKSFQID